jgi:homoisocitrate dehydrogenase
MSGKTICVIGGDGIGPEVTSAAVAILKAAAPELQFTSARAGYGAYHDLGTPLPDETLDACRSADAVLFGAVTTPPNIPGYFSPILRLRKTLDLFSNVRPVYSVPIEASRPGIDMVIVRENTEGLYSGQEECYEDYAVTKRIITRRASERIVDYAFRLAMTRDRKQVTIVHKANVLRETCGLFRKVAFEVASHYPDVTAEELLVDTTAMRLIKDPEHFDVIVTTNLFGDILSDEAAMLVGGLGLAASGNIGETAAVFEPVHGSAPDIAGKGVANPLACISAAAMLLDHIAMPAEAKKVRVAMDQLLRTGPLPADLGGSATTREVVAALLGLL